MRCAWKELVSILPPWLGMDTDQLGKESLQELRLRVGQPPELICREGSIWLNREAKEEDLRFCVNTASRYSPWAAQTTAQGYLTAPGGHRIGLCGEAVVQAGEMTGIRNLTSLCIRVARDFTGIAKQTPYRSGSVLLLGPPGSGKTTLLRDMVRQISEYEAVTVVDERGELFPKGFNRGKRTDVMTGCSKVHGIETLLRVMGPGCIAVDEITAQQDCEAVIQASGCGVRILATAHGASVKDLKQRPLYRPLLEQRLFDHVLVLTRDKSWREERMDEGC